MASTTTINLKIVEMLYTIIIRTKTLYTNEIINYKIIKYIKHKCSLKIRRKNDIKYLKIDIFHYSNKTVNERFYYILFVIHIFLFKDSFLLKLFKGVSTFPSFNLYLPPVLGTNIIYFFFKISR